MNSWDYLRDLTAGDGGLRGHLADAVVDRSALLAVRGLHHRLHQLGRGSWSISRRNRNSMRSTRRKRAAVEYLVRRANNVSAQCHAADVHLLLQRVARWRGGDHVRTDDL